MDSRRFFLTLAVGTPLLLAAPGARAETVTLVSGRDNTLYQNPLGLQSNGSGQYIFAGRDAVGSMKRALLRFSIGDSIPRGSTVSSVSLTLYMSKFPSFGGVPVNVQAQRVLKDWGEGASNAGFEEGGGAQPESGDATWIHTFFDTLNTHLWTNAGGDFSATVSAVTFVDTVLGFYTWNSTPALVADVQEWVTNPSNNFGWILRVLGPMNKTAKRFNAKEDTIDARRPRVTITYTPPVTAVAGPAHAGAALRLEPNTPNPFASRTELAFVLSRPGVARLSIHDAEGRRIATLVDGLLPAGRRVVSWDGRDDEGALAASGIYFTRLESAGETRTRKIQLMR